jgi:hypothetical protein
MTDRARIRIAAAITALFLAGISTAGLTVRDRRLPVTTVSEPDAPSATGPSPDARSDVDESEESERDD